MAMAVYQHHLLIFLYLTLLIPTISHNISAPITFPGLMGSSSAPFNLTALLEKAGCNIFASLITTSSLLKIYESALDNGGFTLFAPKDVAFKADGAPDLSNMSRTHLVTILQYHALPSYTPKVSLKTARGPIATMASSSSGKYNLSVICHGDEVSLSTGVSTAHVASTMLDDTPMSVLTVESLFLPSELLIGVPATPVPSTAPAPGAEAPLPEMSLPQGPTRPCPPFRPRPPPRPRSPPPPHARSPPTPHARSPPPNDDVPPPPPIPVLPPAPSPNHAVGADFDLFKIENSWGEKEEGVSKLREVGLRGEEAQIVDKEGNGLQEMVKGIDPVNSLNEGVQLVSSLTLLETKENHDEERDHQPNRCILVISGELENTSPDGMGEEERPIAGEPERMEL
ncbi:fasciclin-like arabinogalactan protein 8 [Carex littledalei]|uniref:Fasciclin-like arabinogalactan protein 8 n=1 Tax=Carex littledalei TaxID=544730 RepID=A0A833VSG0_9POAL|nr:fasciclin-like arabinogalactan protein 8 [Carex littledalei]